MKIILTTNIKNLGKIGDLVDVKDGYARNFLFPNKMALRKNEKNLAYYEQIKEKIKVEENKKLEEANNTIDKIKSLNIEFSREADEKNQLYGSISKKDILNYLKENNIIIHSDDIIFRNTIRTLGDHEIEISPYLNISEKILIKVNKN